MAYAGNLNLGAHVRNGHERDTGEGIPVADDLDLTQSVSQGADEPPSRFGFAVAASLLFHICAAWAGIHFAGDDVLGGADFETETISVQIVGAIPTAAATAETSTAPAPRSTPVKLQEPPPKQDRPVPEDPLPAKQSSEKEEPEPQPEKPVEPPPDPPKPDETLATPNEFPLVLPREPETAELPLPAAEEKRLPKQETKKTPGLVEDFPRALPKPDREQQKKKRKQDVDKQRTADSTTKKDEPAKPASSAATASASSPNAPAPAVRPKRVTSASKGALRIFARRIARALARSRPRRIKGKGTVLVAFTISKGGGLASIGVKSSSGNARIDRAAVRAVRRARFPKPPAGATRKQRSFIIPYHFRRR
ncbi:MAG: energy transducer TonB family protein [Hyphomicrobiaceae bacterium]